MRSIADPRENVAIGRSLKVRISVLLPVFNSEPFVREAVASILRQTFRLFELVVVDDGSDDGTLGILRSFDDERITILRNEKNLGVVGALNRGLDSCRGEYVARMDADDIAMPERFGKQIEFMEAHRDYACLGTWYRIMGTDRIVETPVSNEEAKIQLLRSSPIAQPTAMLRKDMLGGLRYDAEYPHAEDYKLWAELGMKGKIGNLPIPLLEYRAHSGQITSVFNGKQQKIAEKIRLEQLGCIGVGDPSSHALKHFDFLFGSEGFGFEETLDWAVELISANRRSGYLPEPQFSAYVLRRLASISGQERYEGLATIALRRFKKRIRALRGRHSA